jgi:NarL family two-component system sensor histidine kinase YdfH
MAEEHSTRPQGMSSEDARLTLPFFVMLYIVMVVAYVLALAGNAELRQPARLLPFTGAMLAHGILHWFAISVPENRRWALLYFIAQGALIFVIGMVTGLQTLIIGLYMALLGEAGGILWPNLRAIALAVVFCLILLAVNIIIAWGPEALLAFVPTVGIMTLFVLIYVLMFVRQAEARERAQTLLSELEVAHGQLQAYADRVEELTLDHERERMARELHDTLAQGVAGLVLQLEAVDSHLEQSNPAKAQTVVQQAMRRARTTLDEARRAIQALRPAALEQRGLVDAIGEEVDRLSVTGGIRATYELDAGTIDPPPDVAQTVLRIVQESLTNVARHSQASHVLVRLAEKDGLLELVVEDDGVGFDPAQVDPGCYGLAGMRERAEQIGASLKVESEGGKGTRIVLRMAVGGVV